MKFQLREGTVVDMVLALEQCTTRGARFVTSSWQETFYPYHDIVGRARTSAATLQAAGLRPGDRVAVILATGIHFFDAFLGTQLAGGIPAALYPPFRLGKLDEYFERLKKMLAKIGARFLITDSRIKRLLGPATEVASLEQVIDARDLFDHARSGLAWKPVDVRPEDPIFLQFSSGTTLEPKAVQMSHANLVQNLVMMGNTLDQLYVDGTEADRGGVCWLPLYHDMGLVGNLYLGLSYPATVTYMGPEVFIAQPAMWLQALSKYKAVISAAPHFAYSLCTTRIPDKDLAGVDLSHWLLALNGAEPIDCDGMYEFIRRFEKYGLRRSAMTPVYGLAEAGLGVSFSALDAEPLVSEFDRERLSTTGEVIPGTGRKLPSVGKPLPGLQIEIRNPDGEALGEDLVGKIFVKGPSITQGYYNDPELTAGILGPDGWLDTGDLGFLYQGEVYIAGRAKDLIIIRGRNFAPQEMEELVNLAEGVRLGCCVAVSTVIEGQGEQLIILAEKDTRSDRPDEEIAEEIQKRLLAGISIAPYHVEVLKAGTLPRTSSGKLRRSEALRQFLAGELTPPEKVTTLRILKEVGKSQIAWARFHLAKK